MSNTDTPETQRTRSGRVIRRVTRYEPQEIVEDDSSCSDFSMSDDDDNSLPGSYLGDRSDVDEAFEVDSVIEDDDNSDLEVDEDEEEELDDDDEEEDDDEEDDDVLNWDELTENASDEESSDEDEF